MSREQQAGITGAELNVGDFASSVANAGQGDFVYFDPPYVPLSKTARFTGYTAGGFSQDDQRRLASVCQNLVARGCQVVVTNHDLPNVRALYPDFRVTKVGMRRSISRQARGRGPVGEIILASEATF